MFEFPSIPIRFPISSITDGCGGLPVTVVQTGDPAADRAVQRRLVARHTAAGDADTAGTAGTAGDDFAAARIVLDVVAVVPRGGRAVQLQVGVHDARLVDGLVPVLCAHPPNRVKCVD